MSTTPIVPRMSEKLIAPNEAIKKCQRQADIQDIEGTSPLPTSAIVRCRSFCAVDFSYETSLVYLKRIFLQPQHPRSPIHSIAAKRHITAVSPLGKVRAHTAKIYGLAIWTESRVFRAKVRSS